MASSEVAAVTARAREAIRRGRALFRELHLEAPFGQEPVLSDVTDVESWLSMVFAEVSECRSSADSTLRARLDGAQPPVAVILDDLANVLHMIDALKRAQTREEETSP